MTLSEVLICGRDRMKTEMKLPARPGRATPKSRMTLMTKSKKGRYSFSSIAAAGVDDAETMESLAGAMVAVNACR